MYSFEIKFVMYFFFYFRVQANKSGRAKHSRKTEVLAARYSTNTERKYNTFLYAFFSFTNVY